MNGCAHKRILRNDLRHPQIRIVPNAGFEKGDGKNSKYKFPAWRLKNKSLNAMEYFKLIQFHLLFPYVAYTHINVIEINLLCQSSHW